MNESAVQRTLGRIEGSQEQILNRLDEVSKGLADHSQDDKNALQAVWKRLGDNDTKLNNILVSHERLMVQDEQTKTIGRYIIGFIGSLITLVGAAVVAVLKGHIQLK